MSRFKETLTPEFLRWMVAMIFFAGVSYATFASKTYVDEADRRLKLVGSKEAVDRFKIKPPATKL